MQTDSCLEMMQSSTLLDKIFERQLGTTNSCSREMLGMKEDSFMLDNFAVDYLDPTKHHVVSTIAVSFSEDGKYVASTHGDHTVKIWYYTSGRQYRNFAGHIRTPWTVKFHPRDSNIVASGCLGRNVKVWDIDLNECIHSIKYDYSILSLSFHPFGDIIAVASGPHLHIYQWIDETQNNNLQFTNEYRRINYGYKGDQRYVPKKFNAMKHRRNIRAVMFHPSGNYLFTAAVPSEIDQTQGAKRKETCSLHCITLADLDSDVHREGEKSLDDMPVIIPRIHLYSDGGIDISADGRFLFACAVLNDSYYVVGDSPLDEWTEDGQFISMLSTSPNSPRDAALALGGAGADSGHQIDAEDIEEVEVLSDSDTQHTDGGSNKSMASGDVSISGSSIGSNLHPYLQNLNLNRSPGLGNGNILTFGIGNNYSRNSSCDSNNNDNNKNTGQQPISSNKRKRRLYKRLDSRRNRQQEQEKEGEGEMTGSYPFRNLIQDPQISNNEPLNGLIDRLNALDDHNNNVNETNDVNMGTPTNMNFTGSRFEGDSRKCWPRNGQIISLDDPFPPEQLLIDTADALRPWPAAASPFLSPSIVDNNNTNVVNNNRGSDYTSNNDSQTSRNSSHSVPGNDGQGYDHLCMFRLLLDGDCMSSNRGTILEDYLHSNGAYGYVQSTVPQPILVRCLSLNNKLMKAVTSAKLSCTNRFALVGYGVRDDNQVEGHTHGHAACEIFDLEIMKSFMIMSDAEDEVNIAQFHPDPGKGLLYGTKKGKVRAFHPKDSSLHWMHVPTIGNTNIGYGNGSGNRRTTSSSR